MKLMTVFLVVFSLHLSARSDAQKVTLDLKDVSLEKVFEEVQRQTSFNFFFQDELLAKAKTISIKVKNATVKEVMEACVKGQPFSFEILDKSIVVKSRIIPELPIIAQLPVDIRGKVVDEQANPIPGATITVKGTSIATASNEAGDFLLQGVADHAVLIITSISFESKELSLKGQSSLLITMRQKQRILDSVVMYSTGYQYIPRERSTGSFVYLDNQLVNRKVSTSIIDRLDGVTSGLIFQGNNSFQNNSSTAGTPRTNPLGRYLGMRVRGESSLAGSNEISKDPLIIVDNFPYEGDLRNINPNDIESITVLKDAAAASIWGARSGNGVIVITTRKGRFNQKLKVEVTSNLTIANKPNLFYDRNFLASKSYLEIEDTLFKSGYFDTDINDVSYYPFLSPAVEIFVKLNSNLITAQEADAQLQLLHNKDVRNDFTRYAYQKAVNQQYNIRLSGGSESASYSFSAGLDKNRDQRIENGYQRITLGSNSIYRPAKNLDINIGLNFSQSTTTLDNNLGYAGIFHNGLAMPAKYSSLSPYTALADANGVPLAIVRDYRTSYADSMAKLGFLDWRYRPLNEMSIGDNKEKIIEIVSKLGFKYKIMSFLTAEVQYQNERQTVATRNLKTRDTYYARNLINQFTEYNASTGTFTYNFPVGDILELGDYKWNTNNIRTQLSFDKTFRGLHNITALTGAELRQIKTEGYSRTSLGYDALYGTANGNLNLNTFYPTLPAGSSSIYYATGTLGNDVSGMLYRYISYYSNLAYTYEGKYIATLSARKDGTNIFGVDANKRITPLWSAGLGWVVNRESFYRAEWLQYLKLRATYGFNGNVYNGSAYSTGGFSTSSLTGVQSIGSITAPNPELSWEKVKNINLGIDFSLKGNFLSGSIEIFEKNGQDLLEPVMLPPQTGFVFVTKNIAGTRSKGIDIVLNSYKSFGAMTWTTTALFSLLKDKVSKYGVKPTASNFQTDLIRLVGKPLYGIFSYRWGGLDPTNGDPQGYLNGKISKDYTSILNNFNSDSLVYHGAGRPTVFGALRNDFSFKGFALSINIIYKLGYYFRRASTSLNYQDILLNGANVDYAGRWRQAGDDLTTNVPSLVYPSNINRNTFYQYSEALVEKGDHIRLQDIRLSYDFPVIERAGKTLKNLTVFTYLSNIGILWRANKFGIDPDAYGSGQTTSHTLPNPFAVSFGINAGF